MAKKADKKKEKKHDKKLNESQQLVKFLHSISQKNYSEANKYLQNVVDSKLKAKIGEALKEKLF